MSAAKAPAMTTRQAKRLANKQTAQFQFTASQLRRADRQEEAEKREKKKQEKEQRRELNKRKREEQEEKQRAVKRRLLEEGKISIEDTWGRVTRSQSRLHSYFTTPIEQVVKRPTTPSTVVTVTSENKGETPSNRLVNAIEDKENQQYGPGDSQSDTLINNRSPSAPLIDKCDKMLDCHYLKVASHSSRSHIGHRAPPMSASIKSTPSSVSKAKAKNNTSTVRTNSSGSSMSSRSPSVMTDAKEKEELLLLMDKFEDEIIVAEDETAEIIQGQPAERDVAADSFRSALSEMTVANVNTRAQEKPDTTSVPEGSGLATPSKPRDPFAEFNSGDFSQDDDIDSYNENNDELTWDKENADPLHIYTAKAKMKGTAKSAVTETGKSEAGPSSCHKRLFASRPHSPPKRDNFEDIYDKDFDTGEDDSFTDDEVDDATLMSLSTQRPPPTDRIVDVHGSPHRLTPSRDALVKPSPLTYAYNKTMSATLPPTSKLTVPSKAGGASTHARSADRWAKESLSFNSICDDEWLDIADQVEEELSQKCAAGGGDAATAKGKEREILPPPPPPPPPPPQQHNLTTTKNSLLPGKKDPPEVPLPPPGTQYYLMLMADDIDNDQVFR